MTIRCTASFVLLGRGVEKTHNSYWSNVATSRPQAVFRNESGPHWTSTQMRRLCSAARVVIWGHRVRISGLAGG